MHRFNAAQNMATIKLGLVADSHIQRLQPSDFPSNHVISYLPTHPLLINYTAANMFINSLQHHPPLDAIIISLGGNDLAGYTSCGEIIDAYGQLMLKMCYHDIYPFILPILPRTTFRDYRVNTNYYDNKAIYI